MRRVAEGLESGRWNGALARAMERLWAEAAAPRLVKRLVWREGAEIVAIGGATLGGSGKTPLAIACARALADTGARVAIVGHAYRARPGRARVVQPDDPVELVGDEALVCARACPDVRVTVGRTRQAALDLALAAADVAVLDGVHQTAPRAALALLAVDPDSPWGAAACPPRGDLRAPREELVALADRIVPVASTSRGAWLDGRLVAWDELRAARIGLVTSIARPARVLRVLERAGVRPVLVRTFSDHGRPDLPRGAAVDLWLMTAKCAAHRVASRRGAAPVAVIDHQVHLGEGCRLTLARLGSYARRAA